MWAEEGRGGWSLASLHTVYCGKKGRKSDRGELKKCQKCTGTQQRAHFAVLEPPPTHQHQHLQDTGTGNLGLFVLQLSTSVLQP